MRRFLDQCLRRLLFLSKAPHSTCLFSLIWVPKTTAVFSLFVKNMLPSVKSVIWMITSLILHLANINDILFTRSPLFLLKGRDYGGSVWFSLSLLSLRFFVMITNNMSKFMQVSCWDQTLFCIPYRSTYSDGCKDIAKGCHSKTQGHKFHNEAPSDLKTTTKCFCKIWILNKALCLCFPHVPSLWINTS